MKVGKKLKELKKVKNLKLKDISRDTGLSVSYISDILNERTNPSLDTLEKLTGSLGVSPSYVMEAAHESYKTSAEAELYGAIEDFWLWPERHQKDLLEYVRAKKELIRLETKEQL